MRNRGEERSSTLGKIAGNETWQISVRQCLQTAQFFHGVKSRRQVYILGTRKITERSNMVRMKMRNNDTGDVRWFQTARCQLVDCQLFFVQGDRSHHPVQAVGKETGLFKETVGIAGIE